MQQKIDPPQPGSKIFEPDPSLGQVKKYPAQSQFLMQVRRMHGLGRIRTHLYHTPLMNLSIFSSVKNWTKTLLKRLPQVTQWDPNNQQS